ncbi:MAG: replicative DNA helicase [Anaerolineales bacterium]|nr:replicative DNA helicase [Anaerolineales bacterium]
MKDALCNVDAERAVLGAMLIDPDAVLTVSERLKPEDFYTQVHRMTYAAILALAQGGQPVDVITLSDELARRHPDRDLAAWTYEITGLIGEVPSALHAETYAEQVRDLALRRKVLDAASAAAKLAHDLDHPIDGVLQSVDREVLALHDLADYGRRSVQSAADLMGLVFDRASTVLEGGDTGIIRTGFRDLDAMLGGWRNGAVYTVAARPGIGKTALKLTFAYRAALARKHVQFYSLEMAHEEVASRLLSIRGAKSLREIHNGTFTDADWPTLAEAIGELSTLPLEVDDTPSLNLAQLRSRATRAKLAGKLDLVVVDYLQLMTIDAPKRTERYRELAMIMHGLKALAKELQVPVIVGAQLGRNAEGRMPTLADLRESGDIENDSDGVLFIHRERLATGDSPNKPTATPAELLLAKHRHGPEGVVPVIWVPSRTTFVGVYEPVPQPIR